MKNLGKVTDAKDVATKEYVDSKVGTVSGEVTANDIYALLQAGSNVSLAIQNGKVVITSTDTNTVTKVKGNAESSYRSGNVNLTPANIGAAAASHTHSDFGGYGLTASGNRFGVIPFVGADGVMEVGQYIDFHGSDGDTSDYLARLQATASGLLFNGTAVSLSSHSHNTLFNGSKQGFLNTSGHFVPNATTQQIGTSSKRWNYICASHAMDVSSDMRLKDNFDTDMVKYIAMLDAIDPTSYTIIADDDGVRHIGYIAQQVKCAMSGAGIAEEEFGGFNKYMQDEESSVYGYSLRYEEFIPILHAKIKQLQKEIESLKKEIKNAKNVKGGSNETEIS